MKNSPDIVRASLLPFFSHAADDLNSTIIDLQSNMLSNLKGTSQKGTANLNYFHMVLLPVLASMFEHLGANKYGYDVLGSVFSFCYSIIEFFIDRLLTIVGEIQLAAYKILNGLWILGTCGTKLIDRQWIVEELNRHRPVLGECLGAFASCFPIAFLEPEFNSNNKYSIMYGLVGSNLSEHSLEAQDIMSKLSKNLPPLEILQNQLKDLSESGQKHEDEPHVTEVILPMVCNYLNYWWSYGPSAKEQRNKIKSSEQSPARSESVQKTREASSAKRSTPLVQATPAQLPDKREE
jgi:hypothetical protein